MHRPTPSVLLLAAALALRPDAASSAEEAPASPPAAATEADAAPDAATPTPNERFVEANARISGLLADPREILDREKRAANRDRFLPALVEVRGIVGEMIAAGSAPAGSGFTYDVLLALYDDPETLAHLRAEADADTPEADASAGALMVADASHAADDAARVAVIDRYAARAAARPESEALFATSQLLIAFGDLDEADQARVFGVIQNTLTSDGAVTMTEILQRGGKPADGGEATARLAALVGQPLVLEGSTASGATLSTSDWKGQVILVDFWATWCGPCVAALPDVKELYAAYHGQGLEVLGVSCDVSAEVLDAFLDKQEGMPWPHLFEAGTDTTQQILERLGVAAIPTVFLIDRAGIVRSVTAREDASEVIPRLLAEGAPPSQAPGEPRALGNDAARP